MNQWPYDVPTDSGKLTEAELDAHNREFHPRIPPGATGHLWVDDRCTELETLQRLVREVADINSGSRCLERIADCINMAKQLNHTDFDTARPGFVSWLYELAIADRRPKG